MRRIRLVTLTALVVCGGVTAYEAGRARAYGVPTPNTLSYSGSLMTFGAPDNSAHTMSASLFVNGQSTPACGSGSQSVTCVDGQFTIPLPTLCTTVIHQYQNVNVQLTVDTIVLGSTPITAVPYTLEADTASNYAPGSAIALGLSPSGSITAFGGTTVPAGWLLCTGQTVSRTTYATLYAAIGNAFGQGDGSTTFNVPDLRGKFLRGVDSGAGYDPDTASRTAFNTGGNAGDAVGSYEGDQFASHSHTTNEQYMSVNGGGGGGHTAQSGGGAFPYTTYTDNGMSASGGNETRPRNVYVYYIIKT